MRNNVPAYGNVIERYTAKAIAIAACGIVLALFMLAAISFAPSAAWAGEAQTAQQDQTTRQGQSTLMAQDASSVQNLPSESFDYLIVPDPLGVGPKLQLSDLASAQSASAKSGQAGRSSFSAQADDGVITYAEAVERVKQALIAREPNVEVVVETGASYQEVFAQMVEDALAEDDDGQHGDYLRWVMGSWGATMSYYDDGSEAYPVTFAYTFTYKTTSAQEEQALAKAKEALAQIHQNQDMSTDYQKVKAIYDYICEHVTYDHDNLADDSNVLKYTAYAALVDGTAVCQGYASLFYLMAKLESVPCRIISGLGYHSDGQSEAHGWNIARVGSWYYNLDSTWDAPLFKHDVPYEYFLRSDDDFTGHERGSGSDGGLDYTSAEFYAAYPMAAESFVPGESDEQGQEGSGSDDQELSSAASAVNAFNAKQSAAKALKVNSIKAKAKKGRKAKLSWKVVKGASGYQVQYAPNKKFRKSLKTLTVNGGGKKSIQLKKLKAKKTYYFRIRPYTVLTAPHGGNVTVYGAWSKKAKAKAKA